MEFINMTINEHSEHNLNIKNNNLYTRENARHSVYKDRSNAKARK